MTQVFGRISVLTLPKISKIWTMAMMVFLISAGLWAIGFSNIPAVHDALHDLRHGMGFPCH